MSDFNTSNNPSAQSVRVIAFEAARVHKGFTGEWLLTVKGEVPCANMEVRLIPLVYVKCPDYWGIEVVGILPSGVCLTAMKPYEITIPLTGIIGSKGIEVVGSNQSEKIEVEGGCS